MFSYPSTTQYKDMVHALLLRFKFLENEHMSYEDAVVFWHAKLKTHFKNTRVKNKENIPEIFAKRATFSRKRNTPEQFDIGQHSQRKSFRACGVKNYIVAMYEGEDVNSLEKHVKRLKEQSTYSAVRKDDSIISLSMDKTFPDRRKMIVEDLSPVSAVLSKYPTLCGEEQVYIFLFKPSVHF